MSVSPRSLGFQNCNLGADLARAMARVGTGTGKSERAHHKRIGVLFAWPTGFNDDWSLVMAAVAVAMVMMPRRRRNRSGFENRGVYYLQASRFCSWWRRGCSNNFMRGLMDDYFRLSSFRGSLLAISLRF